MILLIWVVRCIFSVLSTLRTIVRLFLVFLSIPCSFSMISYMYYKYENLSDINFEFVDIDEGSARINRIIYSFVLVMSIVPGCVICGVNI